uniref:(California timema) hypothetical protein n=1 Tax=Timema californicum TaxID=61474 RepID=A0A7R9J544_TIMCA|nr:unnamed protein product [Timema californicum]
MNAYLVFLKYVLRRRNKLNDLSSSHDELGKTSSISHRTSTLLSIALTSGDSPRNAVRASSTHVALSTHIMPKPSDERLKPYTGPNKSCVFCFKAQGTDHLSEDVDELLHGKFYKLEKIITHYFCLVRI